MTTGAHDAGGGFGRSAGANAARGIMVIVAAVIVGILLMNRGLDGNGSSDGTAAAVSGDQDATDATDDTTVDATTPTTDDSPAAGADTTVAGAVPLPAPRDPSQVAVLVLNGADGAQGVAGRGTDVLKSQNYITKDPKNADVNGPSVVLFQPGYESEAIAVATAFGVDPAAVVQPFDPATSPVADTQGANVIVRIGNDGVIKV